MMLIKTAEFVGSYVDVGACPAPNKPEYAFIGRSNVGKSSLINMLCQTKDMARTSGQPGKTQTINHFEINKQWYLVDLPGYGYAKVPKHLRGSWEKMIGDYLCTRPNLMCAFLLIDSCVPPQEKDLEFAAWLAEHQVPFVLVYTKTDRKKAKKNESGIPAFQKAMLEHWAQMPQEFITSSEKAIGREELLDFIEATNALFSEPK